MDLLCLICLPVPDAHSRQSVERVLINPHASTAYRMKLTFHKLFTERTLSPILKAPPIKELCFVDERLASTPGEAGSAPPLWSSFPPPHPRACLGPFHCGYGLIMYKEAKHLHFLSSFLAHIYLHSFFTKLAPVH